MTARYSHTLRRCQLHVRRKRLDCQAQHDRYSHANSERHQLRTAEASPWPLASHAHDERYQEEQEHATESCKLHFLCRRQRHCGQRQAGRGRLRRPGHGPRELTGVGEDTLGHGRPEKRDAAWASGIDPGLKDDRDAKNGQLRSAGRCSHG